MHTAVLCVRLLRFHEYVYRRSREEVTSRRIIIIIIIVCRGPRTQTHLSTMTTTMLSRYRRVFAVLSAM